VPAYPGCRRKEAVKPVFVCLIVIYRYRHLLIFLRLVLLVSEMTCLKLKESGIFSLVIISRHILSFIALFKLCQWSPCFIYSSTHPITVSCHLNLTKFLVDTGNPAITSCCCFFVFFQHLCTSLPHGFTQILIIIDIRPHHSTTYVDAAYCYRPSSVVCHRCEPCKNDLTDWDAVWAEDSGGSKEPCIRWGPNHTWEGAILRGKGWPIVKYKDALLCAVQKRLNRSTCRLGYGLG